MPVVVVGRVACLAPSELCCLRLTSPVTSAAIALPRLRRRAGVVSRWAVTAKRNRVGTMRIVKIVVLLALAYGAYYLYQARFAPANELIGQWKSHKGKSMRSYQQGGLTQQQESLFSSALGKMAIEVTDTEWISRLDGEVDRIGYTINARDGDCYQLRLANNEARYVCVVDGDLHLSTNWRNAKEVFVRIDQPQ